MNRTTQLLAALLIIQIVLAAFLLWPRNASVAAGKLLPDLNTTTVTSLTLVDNKDTIRIAKSGEQWVLPDAGDFAVKAAGVTDLISKLMTIDTRQLVASNPGNFAQLKVADNDFVRKVEIATSDGKSYTLIVGNSPNTRSTNVRLGDSDNVYIARDLAGADVRLDYGNWIETSYYTATADAITAVTLQNASGMLDFRKDISGTWQLAGLANGESFSDTVWSGLVSRLTNLSMNRPLGKEAKPEYGLEAPLATITLQVRSSTAATDTTAAPSSVQFLVGAEDVGDSAYYAKASTSDYYVKVNSFTLGDFVKKGRSDFVLSPLGTLTGTTPITATAEITAGTPVTTNGVITPTQ